MVDASQNCPEPGPPRGPVPSPALNPDAAYYYGFNPNGGSRRYWQALNRKKLLLVGAAACGAVLGFLTTLPAVSVYQAHTSVEIAGINGNFLNMKQSDPVNYADSDRGTSDLQTQVLILRSDSLRKRVVTKLGVADRHSRPLEMAASSVRVWPSPSSRVVQITVDSTDPGLAANYANTLVNEFIEQNIEARWQSSLRTGQWLTRQTEDMRKKLERSEAQLQEYTRKSGLLFTNEKNSVSEDHLRQLQVQLSAVQADRVAKQSRLEMLNSSPPDSVPDILEDDSMRAYREKIADLQRQIADLLPTYTQESARIRRLRAQIESLEKANGEARTLIATKIRNEYAEALRREQMVEKDFHAEASHVSSEGESMIRYNLLKGEVESNRQAYDTMLQQLRQSALASAMRASNIRVVDPAEKPERPYRPNRNHAGVVGAIGGLILCAGFIVFRQYADQVIRDPGEVTSWTGIPELGLIPDYRLGHLNRYRARARFTNRAQQNAGATVLPRTALGALQPEFSRVSECFRSTLTTMLFSRQDNSRPRTVVITSASPMEGKSTVTANLGIALAQLGIRVLLIDADLRRPCLHTIFELEPQSGLTELLKAIPEENGEIAVAPYVLATGVAGLSVMPAGRELTGSTGLLYCDRLQKLIRTVREQYDVVLVDTPPMLGIPDARLIARATEKTILVVRAGKTTRSAAAAASKRLADDGIDILGAIVNAWSPSNSPDGYYGYGARSYRQHYYDSSRVVGA